MQTQGSKLRLYARPKIEGKLFSIAILYDANWSKEPRPLVLGSVFICKEAALRCNIRCVRHHYIDYALFWLSSACWRCILRWHGYIRFVGYLKDCKACPLQSQCMGKAPLKIGRQVQFKKNCKEEKLSYTDKMRIKIVQWVEGNTVKD